MTFSLSLTLSLSTPSLSSVCLAAFAEMKLGDFEKLILGRAAPSATPKIIVTQCEEEAGSHLNVSRLSALGRLSGSVTIKAH